MTYICVVSNDEIIIFMHNEHTGKQTDRKKLIQVIKKNIYIYILPILITFYAISIFLFFVKYFFNIIITSILIQIIKICGYIYALIYKRTICEGWALTS